MTMGKSSSKAAFIIFLAFIVMISVTVEIVEAKRLLLEETLLDLLHHEAFSLTVKPLGRFERCTPPCKELCFGTGCYCVCE
ncbi:PREDICTED: uncharacterized protein LOC109127605 [Camelina sativa]|uniref:Uncharacterized protein LOC109127605 n=1 Tax=Camelina sativa TaxID=90675 RepID=A0ABM1QMY4_CAMSA|nr:PREDICTED: uncharacterized protein LOC109127605 [Camelina sativa]